MKIELSEDQRWWIEHEVASGRFDTPEAVIAHAIRQAKFLALREKIQASIAGGGEYTLEEVMASVEARAEQLAKEGF
jgi:antitoxin ParD1/3/4